MKILITGSAGFIGFHLVKRILQDGHNVIGLDNINDYYDPELKFGRLKETGISKEAVLSADGNAVPSTIYPEYSFYRFNLENRDKLNDLFKSENIDIVINLAAQAGVRYSLQNPYAYVDSNVSGFVNLLECCRNYKIKHLVYASSSSVYGLNNHDIFSTSHNVDHPISLYAATKKSNELMAHVYSHLFNLPTTGLRFFTVYGPWGRPDMALFLFTKAIIEDKPIEIFNNGLMKRDFTYVDDVVEGVAQVANKIPEGNPLWDALHPDPASAKAPYKIYNIGNNNPVKLLDFVEAMERNIGKQAIKKMMPLQPGDVVSTYADVTELIEDIGYKPSTNIEEGVKKSVDWYKNYYQVNG